MLPLSPFRLFDLKSASSSAELCVALSLRQELGFCLLPQLASLTLTDQRGGESRVWILALQLLSDLTGQVAWPLLSPSVGGGGDGAMEASVSQGACVLNEGPPGASGGRAAQGMLVGSAREKGNQRRAAQKGNRWAARTGSFSTSPWTPTIRTTGEPFRPLHTWSSPQYFQMSILAKSRGPSRLMRVSAQQSHAELSLIKKGMARQRNETECENSTRLKERA